MSAGGSRTISESPLLRIRGLCAAYPSRRGLAPALRDVDLDVQPGAAFGLVGESGCGKSTLARVLLRLMPARAGEIQFDGCDWLALAGEDLRRRRPTLQMVFQDPLASLNPRLKIETIVGEAAAVHGRAPTRAALRDQVAFWLERVGLSAADMQRYPHEFSGGQRQRIAIARALILKPRLLVCDEAVSALDVCIQARTLELLRELQAELGLACLFIAHNLAVVKTFCQRVAVMYLGRIVECGPTERVLARPAHPYTQALLAATPEPCGGRAQLAVLRGEPPDPLSPPSGCPFRERCPQAVERCAVEAPPLQAIAGLHFAACHFACGSN